MNEQQPEEGTVTQTPDITQIVQEQVQKAMDDLGEQIAEGLVQVAQWPTPPPPPQTTQTFEHVLGRVDPSDSEAALAMLDFLLKTGRLNRVGVLDGGQGYLFVYQEPKGTTKQGYVPGGTKGDRIVDAAVDQARAEGKVPVKRGMCPYCLSAVKQAEGGSIVVDDDDVVGNPVQDRCGGPGSPNGAHGMA